MSKPTLDYFTPERVTRAPVRIDSLLLGLLAWALVIIPYVLRSAAAFICLPLAVFVAVSGLCAALDAEEPERRATAGWRFAGMGVSAVALLAAAVSFILAAFVVRA